MAEYYAHEDEILDWLANHPNEKWTDPDFSCSFKQFYEDEAILPHWAPQLKNL